MKFNFCIVYLLFLNFYVANSQINLQNILPFQFDEYNTKESFIYDHASSDKLKIEEQKLMIPFDYDSLLVRNYFAKDKPSISTKVFLMKSPGAAFGAFTIQSEMENIDFGQGGQFASGKLIFWKGKYLVSISSEIETVDMLEDFASIAREAESHMSKGKLPEIINLLPDSSLTLKHLKYFNNFIWQNSLYFISDEDIFLLKDSASMIVTQCFDSVSNCFLGLIEYPTVQRAKKGFKNAKESYFKGANEQGFIKKNEQTFDLIHQEKKYLICILNGTSKQFMLGIRDMVKYKIDKTTK